MKTLFKKFGFILLLITFLLPGSVSAAPIFVSQGGTGVGTITGIPYGTGTAALGIVTIGAGLNFSAGTLTSSFVNPMTTGGDIIYGGTSGVPTRLGNGSSGQALLSQGGTLAPQWATLPGGGNALTTNPLSQFAATTSAQLAGVISNETGSGLLVFGTSPTIASPTLTAPVLGVATATSINGLTINTTTGTLAITNAKTLTATNSLTLTGTDGSTINIGAATSGKILIGDGTNMVLSAPTYPLSAGTAGNILTSDGANWLSSPSPVPTVQTFNSSGTYTKPARVKYITVQMWAAGGSGSTGTSTNGPGGGGGGAYNTITLLASQVGSTETVTVGVGGAAVTGSGTSGNDGGNTSFGSFMTVFGGDGNSGGGGGGISGVGTANGGAPIGGTQATAPANSSIYGGGAGGNNTIGAGQSIYGGGGAGFSTGGNGATGGISYYGGGGGAGGDNSNNQAGGTSTFGGAGGAGGFTATPATAGSAPGGGGGGTRSNTAASGAGANGRIIVNEFY